MKLKLISFRFYLCRYGPFWICSTLVFVTAALGNFAAYLSHKSSDSATDSWHYDVNKVSWAAFMFYGYVGVIPLGLYFLLKYLGVVSGLVQLWCLYGYSLFVFIPASVRFSPTLFLSNKFGTCADQILLMMVSLFFELHLHFQLGIATYIDIFLGWSCSFCL